jgi:hypothetical protein
MPERKQLMLLAHEKPTDDPEKILGYGKFYFTCCHELGGAKPWQFVLT